MKRQVPILICALSCLLMMIPFYLPRLEELNDIFLKWFMIIAVFAFLLGGASLILVNGQKISKKAPGWGYNAVLLTGLFVTLAAGLVGGIKEGTFFNFIFQYIYTPLSATVFSLLAFFIASAAFRAFRAKTWEAALLLVAAFIVMLGRVPLGEYLWSHTPILSKITPAHLIEDWIMGCFNTAGQRAILLGATVGLISMSLKIMLGIERPYMGGD